MSLSTVALIRFWRDQTATTVVITANTLAVTTVPAGATFTLTSASGDTLGSAGANAYSESCNGYTGSVVVPACWKHDLYAHFNCFLHGELAAVDCLPVAVLSTPAPIVVSSGGGGGGSYTPPVDS